MAEETETTCMPLCGNLDPKEDRVIDQEVDILDPFLSINEIYNLKEHLLEESSLG